MTAADLAQCERGDKTQARYLEDYRDMVITEFADSECALREEVAEHRARVDAYREICRAAIHELHRVTRQRDQARWTIAAMREAQRMERRSHQPRRVAA
jgi:hypothetical protein